MRPTKKLCLENATSVNGGQGKIVTPKGCHRESKKREGIQSKEKQHRESTPRSEPVSTNCNYWNNGVEGKGQCPRKKKGLSVGGGKKKTITSRNRADGKKEYLGRHLQEGKE